jgi:hypothetical protein
MEGKGKGGQSPFWAAEPLMKMMMMMTTTTMMIQSDYK